MKRFFDFAMAFIGLILASPILLILAVSVKLTSAGPVFYRGTRVGLNGRQFRIFKFRTMVVDAEKKGGDSTSDDDPRVTKIGKLLREYKLDEIPQLMNVLVGDMSLVGPRPQVEWAVRLYNDEQRKLLSVRPGITDYASIEFRKEGEILVGSKDPDRDYLEKIAPRKLQLGLKYVNHHNLWVDLKIIFATIRALISG